VRQIVLSIVFVVYTITAYGWGQTGHRVVGQIAQNHLKATTKKALIEIMGHESLVEASTWMDDIKSDSNYKHSRSWHYVNIPNGMTYETSTKSKKGDAYEATQRMVAILKNKNSHQKEKVEAIRMLVHLVGDFHQPLHVGNGKDQGGNSIKIRWFSKYSNLHQIWDSGIINSKQFSYSELAKIIDKSGQKLDKSFYSTDLDIWVKEAIDLRPQIYDIGDAKNLSYNYSYKNWETVKIQLHKGGLRLAAILNEIYS